MRVIILTSIKNGTASYFVSKLIENGISIELVVYNKGEIVNKKGFYLRKLKKLLRIGLFGALNGIRMRKWYGDNIRQYLEIDDIFHVCRTRGVPIEETPSINCSKTAELFHSVRPDIGLSLGNSYISRKIFSIPKFGMINVHGEELPEYKNAQSIIWQIFNESRQTGYTIHEINSGIDTGRILKIETFPIYFRSSLGDTVSFNCAEILKRSLQGMVELLKDYQYFKSTAIIQEGGNSYTTPTIKQFFRILKNFRSLSKSTNAKHI
jgi:methionyl-tRNA formyltransferase